MTLPVSALIALKALQIGSAAASSPSRETALKMLNQALSWLGTNATPNASDQQAFYHATRAEMMRVLGDPTSDRETLKSVCGDRSGSVYDWYMKLVEATEARTGLRWQGSTSPYAAGGGSSREPDNPHLSSLGRTYRAMQTVGLDQGKLTLSNRRYLEKVTLSHILHKHGIPFTS